MVAKISVCVPVTFISPISIIYVVNTRLIVEYICSLINNAILIQSAVMHELHQRRANYVFLQIVNIRKMSKYKEPQHATSLLYQLYKLYSINFLNE